MEILRIVTLRGPNLWSRRPVLEAWVDLQELQDCPSNSIPGFNERLASWLPGLIEHRCSVGERGGFLQRLRDGTYPAHMLEHVSIELQTLAGTPVGFGKARETSRQGLFKVVMRFHDERVARACLLAGRELLLAAIEDRPFDVAGEVGRLRALAAEACPGPEALAILSAAEARGIPARVLAGGEILLGQGVRQRRLRTADGAAADAEASRAAASEPDGEARVGALFPEGEDGRIPVVSVTGTNGKTIVTRLIAHLLRTGGLVTGMSCSDGALLDGRWGEGGNHGDDHRGARGARAVLAGRRVEAAVLESSGGEILEEGLGFDRCQVAVVTNLAEADHLGRCFIDTPEQMVTVKRSGVDVVLPSGTAVLNGADPLVAEMAALSAGGVIFFALDGNHPVLADHRAQGKRTAFSRDGWMVLAEGDAEFQLIELAKLPMAHGGRVPFQLENALAAACAAWALAVPVELLRAGLESFPGDERGAPGRFHLFESDGATVVVDGCHNTSALAAIIAALDRFAQPRRTIVYSGGAGRRDCDLVRQGALLACAFDRVILFDDSSAQDRPEGAARALLAQGLAAGGRVREVREVSGHRRAAGMALSLAGPGELVVIQTEESGAAPTVEIVRAWARARALKRQSGCESAGGAQSGQAPGTHAEVA